MRQYIEFFTEALPPKAGVQEYRAASEDEQARLIGTGTCLGQRFKAQPALKQRRRYRTGSERAGTHHNYRKKGGWPAFA